MPINAKDANQSERTGACTMHYFWWVETAVLLMTASNEGRAQGTGLLTFK